MNNYRKDYHYYNPQKREFARKLRHEATKAEKKLWNEVLKKKQLGYTFNRQRPVLDYIADFMCKELKLVIEVDGKSHDNADQQKYDRYRQKRIEDIGFTVLRFSNDQVYHEIDKVRWELESWIHQQEAKKQTTINLDRKPSRRK